MMNCLPLPHQPDISCVLLKIPEEDLVQMKRWILEWWYVFFLVTRGWDRLCNRQRGMLCMTNLRMGLWGQNSRRELYICNPVKLLLPESSQVQQRKFYLISPSTRIDTLYWVNNRNSYTETIRTEYVARPKTTDLATSQIKSFYRSIPDGPNTLLDKILSFPRLTLLSLAALITYTIDFGLQNVFTSKYFQHFSSRAHMLLNGSTISSLEIYRNQTDFSEKGSLLWVLDHTRTKFGRRMLRKWIGRPLLARW